MKCEFSDKCPIPIFRDEEEWRKKYAEKFCDNNCEECNRRKIRVVEGAAGVPLDLLPDGNRHSKSVFERDLNNK